MVRTGPAMSGELYRMLDEFGSEYGEKRIFAAAYQLLTDDEKQRLSDMLLTACTQPFPDAMPAADRARYLYEALRRNIVYYPEPPFPREAYTFLGALKGRAVCLGVSELFHLCLLAGGIANEIVIGSIDGKTDSLHAWNRVTLEDGSSYFCDLTWDLTVSDSPPRYFLKGTDAFSAAGHMFRADQYPGVSARDYPATPRPDSKTLALYTELWKTYFFQTDRKVVT